MLLNVEHLTYIGQGIIGELLTIVGKKDFRHAIFKCKFLQVVLATIVAPLLDMAFAMGHPVRWSTITSMFFLL